MLGIHAQVSAGVAYNVISWNVSFPVFVGHSMRSLANAVQAKLPVAVFILRPRPEPAAAAASCFSKEAFEGFLVHSIKA